MDQKINEASIKKIEKQLLAQKKQIMNDLQNFSRADNHEADDRTTSFPEYGDKPDENAQEISDYSANVVTEKVLEKSLADVDKALTRIKNGTYGICKYCGNPIAEKRLLARPTANSCVSCKTELQEND
jgi:RNA polymerase-binding protein DksA